MARTTTKGTSFSQAACAMAVPSISQHMPPKPSVMRFFCSALAMNWSPETTRPA